MLSVEDLSVRPRKHFLCNEHAFLKNSKFQLKSWTTTTTERIEIFDVDFSNEEVENDSSILATTTEEVKLEAF